MTDDRRFSDAAQRNRDPILGVLSRHVRAGDRVLEVASGTGEHAVYFGARLPIATWQPTDPDPGARASIDAWRAFSQSAHVLPAAPLDVFDAPWPFEADVVLAVNMVHISPWEATPALFRGIAGLRPRVVYLYGPYRRDGAHTAPSNEVFDGWLKTRDPRFGVRDLEAVLAEAEGVGLRLVEVVPMPSNNFSVVLAGPA